LGYQSGRENTRVFVKNNKFFGTNGAVFRLTPGIHEVRAPLETLAFLGRSNLVEPDEVSGGR